MSALRKVIFWLHLSAGVTAGTVILIMSVTGFMLAFERQITAWADGHGVVPPAGGGPTRTMEMLLAGVRESESNNLPATVTIRADPTAPVEFGYGPDRTVFADPYRGKVLGEGSKRTRAFFHLMTDWHRWLGTNEKGRAVGRAITDGCNLAFLFMVVSGFYLWWPRNWGFSSLRGIVVFNRGLRGRARDWNWHNTIGFWCAVPLFVMVVAGVVMSYPWANALVYRLTRSEPPPPQRAEGQRDRFQAPPADLDLAGFNGLWSIAQRRSPGWQSITLRLPKSVDAPVTFLIDRGNGGRPDLRSTLVLDQESGDIVRREDFSGYDLGRKVRMWLRWVHTGEAGGPFGQTIAMLASAGAAALVCTGMAMAVRRLFGKKLSVAEGDASAAPQIVASK